MALNEPHLILHTIVIRPYSAHQASLAERMEAAAEAEQRRRARSRGAQLGEPILLLFFDCSQGKAAASSLAPGFVASRSITALVAVISADTTLFRCATGFSK
jgi:hypothetical protein